MMSANDDLRDSVIRHSVYLAKYGEGLADKVLALLNSADKDIAARIAAGLASELGEKRLREMLEELRVLSDEVYSKAFDVLEDELTKQAEMTAEYAAKALSDTLPFYRASLPLPAKLAVIATTSPIDGHLLKSWTDSMSARRVARVEQTLRVGMVQGETIDQLVRRVMGSKAKGYKDGVLDISRRSARSMVITANATVAAVAREQTFNANAKVIKSVQWVSTLDDRTSSICQSRDGMVWKLGSDHPKPPAHIRCRSILTPVTKSAKELGLKPKNIDPGTRASMDGQVAKNIKYPEWLAKQSPERQDKALNGKARGDLFRSGQIKAEDLYRTDGSFKSLSELRAALDLPARPPNPVAAPVAAPKGKVDLTAINERERSYVIETGKKTGVEHLVAFDRRTGEVVERKSGTKNSVVFSNKLDAAIKDPANSLVLHHNHPSSSSLSYQDLKVATQFPGVHSIYAHGHNGSEYYAESGKFPLKKATVDAISGSLQKSLQRAINLERINIPDAQLMHNHLVWMVVHKREQIVYRHKLSGTSAEAFERNKEYYNELLKAFDL